MKTQKLILMGLFAALTVVGGRIVVPLGPVPFTMQNFFVSLAGLLLGAAAGAGSQVVYLLIGLIGLPIFSFGGGPQSILQPTFGYLLGFVACAWVTGAMAGKKTDWKTCLIACFSGLAVLYIVGVTWLWGIMNYVTLVPMSYVKAWQVGCITFLPMDVVKMIIVSFIASRILPRLRNQM